MKFLEICGHKFADNGHKKLIAYQVKRKKENMKPIWIYQRNKQTCGSYQKKHLAFVQILFSSFRLICVIEKSIAEKIYSKQYKANNKPSMQIDPQKHNGREPKKRIMPVMVLESVQKMIPDNKKQ